MSFDENVSSACTLDSESNSQELNVTVESKTRYERCQRRVFYFLEKPTLRIEVAYHVINLIFIFGSIVIGVLSTLDTLEKSRDSGDSETFQLFLFVYEIGLLAWFSIEYILRVWSCSIVKKYRGVRGRFRFMKTFYMGVDIFIIVSTIVTAILHVKSSYFTLLRTTRFLQVFRVLRIDRQKGDLGMMFRVLYSHRKELLTCYFVGFIILFGGAYIVYIFEKDNENASINDMMNGLYWALITVTSVGFGDMSPVTWGGKITTGIFAVVGCAFFALPAGILGSGFAIQVSKAKNQKKVIKIRNPAAIVIQTAWRNYAVRKHHNFCQGTWKHFLPQITGTAAQWPGYYSCLPGINAICNNKSFDAYNIPFEEIKMTTPSWYLKGYRLRSPSNALSHISHESDEETSKCSPTTPCLDKRKFSWTSFELPTRQGSRTKKVLRSSVSTKQNKYKSAIRFILRIKFWNCIKTFKNKRYPFIEVRDIREKSTQWHLEKMSMLKEMQQMSVGVQQEVREMREQMTRKRNSVLSSVKRKREKKIS